MLGYIIVASVAISTLSFLGVIALAASKQFLERILLLLVALAAGTLMGNVFFHLLPEAIVNLPVNDAFLAVLASFMFFFLIEKALHWHHCHRADHASHVDTFGYINLLGDAVHNFTDGMMIAASFVASVPLGIATSLAIALHEIPQEIGDFGVLVHSGFSRKRALFLNFLVSLGALVGALVGYFLVTSVPILEAYLIPIAAGGFLYIAAADLLPEIRDEERSHRVLLSSLTFVAGVILMYFLFANGGGHNGEHVETHESLIHDDGMRDTN